MILIRLGVSESFFVYLLAVVNIRQVFGSAATYLLDPILPVGLSLHNCRVEVVFGVLCVSFGFISENLACSGSGTLHT